MNLFISLVSLVLHFTPLNLVLFLFLFHPLREAVINDSSFEAIKFEFDLGAQVSTVKDSLFLNVLVEYSWKLRLDETLQIRKVLFIISA